jgi:hypothetical protein
MAAFGGNPVRKMVVKLKKRENVTSTDYFTPAWSGIKTFVSAVHSMQFSGHSFEELYSGVSNMVATKHGAELYAALKNECRGHISNVVSGFDKPAQVSTGPYTHVI